MREKLPLVKHARAQNIAMLCAQFDAFLEEYSQAEAVFGNVSDHFYHRALARRQEVGLEALASDRSWTLWRLRIQPIVEIPNVVAGPVRAAREM